MVHVNYIQLFNKMIQIITFLDDLIALKLF